MIAKLLKIQTDTEGYLQSANVRHRLINSPRKGIFYTGSCHDEVDEQDQAMELELMMSSIYKLADNQTDVLSPKIEINSKKCRKCLTCFRTCPHGAIILNDDNKPYIDPRACFSCGLCVSGCPALAIESRDYSDESCINQISQDAIAIFACQRSGALAADKIGHDSRINIIDVPCACRISENILLKTLEAGTKKIVLACCHQDNCRSMKGNQKARSHTKRLTRLPGIDNSTIIFHPVAANESNKFEAFLAREILPN